MHEARDSDETALIGDVAESRAEASGNQDGGEESVLLETAAVGVTAVMTRLLWHMAHQRHVEMRWMQSSQYLFWLAVLFRERWSGAMILGIRRQKEALVKRVRAAIE